MITWFIFALGAALGQSVSNLFSKYLASRLPKLIITFGVFFPCSVILFLISFIKGMPEIGDKFLMAILITGILNIIAYLLLLRAYQIADLSTVFPMVLLTPIFLTGTSYLILKETPSLLGIAGMLIIILGLFIIVRSSVNNNSTAKNIDTKKGILYGIIVALLWSISVNFDKIAVLNSDPVFSGASVFGIISLGTLPFVLYRLKNLEINREKIKTLYLVLPAGCILALTLIFHNLALISGLASYTIAIKRTAVIFGVLWGVIFFKERNLKKKLAGALIAIIGIALILIS